MRRRNTRVGVIGVAVDRHPRVHLQALNSMEDVDLVAFCDVDAGILETACREYGVEKGFLDREEMLEKVEMDAVWVVCNYRFTYEVALDCLQAGLDTLLEKPPGLSVRECRALAEAAAESGSKSMVAFNRRFNSVITEAKRLLESADSVENPAAKPRTIQVVDSDYGKGKNAVSFTDKDGHVLPPLWVDAIHHVDTLRFFLGDVEEVMSANACHYGPSLDSFHAIIKFENGAIGQLNSNYHALKIERLSLFARDAWAGLQGMQSQINEGTAYAGGCWHELKGEALMGRTDTSGFWDEDRFFIDCVKEDRPVSYPASDLSDATKTMQLVEAILAGS